MSSLSGPLSTAKGVLGLSLLTGVAAVAAYTVVAKVARRGTATSLSSEDEAGLRRLIVPASGRPSFPSRVLVSSSVPRPPRLRPLGLKNGAQLCFLNSVLQGMSSLPSMMSYLDAVVSAKAVAEAAGSRGGASRQLLSELLRECLRGLSGEEEIKSPSLKSWGGAPYSGAILGMVRSSNPLFSSVHQQQDAQEMLNCLLGVVEEEFKKYCAGVRGADDPFEGRLGGGLRCEVCGHERRTASAPFREIQLTPAFTVEAALER